MQVEPEVPRVLHLIVMGCSIKKKRLDSLVNLRETPAPFSMENSSHGCRDFAQQFHELSGRFGPFERDKCRSNHGFDFNLWILLNLDSTIDFKGKKFSFVGYRNSRIGFEGSQL